MDAAETDVAISKYVKIIYQVEGWSPSCSMEGVDYTTIIRRFPRCTPEVSKKGKGQGSGALLARGQFPSLPRFAVCLQSAVTR